MERGRRLPARSRTSEPGFGDRVPSGGTGRGGRAAPRRGIEPLSLHGQWSCDASRITRRESSTGVADGNRTRLRTFTECPRRQTSTATRRRIGGSSWGRTTFSWVSTRRYHSTSSRPDVWAPAEGIEPSMDRLTAGCLTTRLRWNETALRRRHIAEAKAQGGRRGAPVVAGAPFRFGIELSKTGDRQAMCRRIRPRVRRAARA